MGSKLYLSIAHFLVLFVGGKEGGKNWKIRTNIYTLLGNIARSPTVSTFSFQIFLFWEGQMNFLPCTKLCL